MTASPAHLAARDLLFGDLPLEQWLGEPDAGPPWSDFRAAHALLASGKAGPAREILQRIAGAANLEPRHTLQAWHALRELGVQPSVAHAKDVLGVVVDVGMDGGLDTLAAYADRTARYYNHSGAAIVWERPGPQLDNPINALLAEARFLVRKIGPWNNARPAPPRPDHVQIQLLTPSGLHFGLAPMHVMQRDPIGGPTFAAAANLLAAITSVCR